MPFDQRSLIYREAWFPPCFVRQKQQQKKTFFAQRFQTIFQQKCSNLRPLLSITFPQEFRISKNIGYPILGSGGKKAFKRYLKSEYTDGQTDGQTDEQTDGHFDLQKASAQKADALNYINLNDFLQIKGQVAILCDVLFLKCRTKCK